MPPRSIARVLFLCLLPLTAGSLLASTEGADDDCCQGEKPADPHATTPEMIAEIPDTRVLDQDGREFRFRTDLLEGQTVAISFFFTTCKTICPPLTATLRKVQTELGDRYAGEISLISISVDPGNDVPERLKQFSGMFGAEPGWRFLTGNKQEIDQLLTALGAATAAKFDHTPMVLVGNLASGEWTRTYGLAPAERIVEVIEGVHTRAMASVASREAESYFPNLPLVTQHGKQVRFYDDVVKGNLVLMHVMFTECTSICPPMLTNLAKVADLLGDRLGKDALIVSITVDPETDTPERLLEYSKSFGGHEGWLFLTGATENVKAVLGSLGAWVDDPQTHNAWLILGNEPTGDWRKLLATAPPRQISGVVRSMLEQPSPAVREFKP